MMLWLLSLAFALETPLVPAGSTWNYWDQGTDPGAGWTTVGFDDSTWSSGDAPLGYGSFGLNTEVGYGGDPLNRFVTTWFRNEFVANNTSSFTGLSLLLKRDDGAVVYLNGIEVARSNLPGGAIDSATLATNALDGLLDDEWLRIALDPSLVQDGDNVLAVELHQASLSSTDIHLEVSFSGWDDAGAVIRGPYLQHLDDDGVIVRWRTEGPSPSRVFVGDAVGSLTTNYDDSALALDHEVQVSGLSPNTTKIYGVGSPSLGILAGDDADHTFTTAPVPGTVQPFRAWVLGDPGTANSNQEAVRDAFLTWSGGAYPELTLLLGDNAYNSGTDVEYQNAMFDIYPDSLRRVPFWSAIGNHDGYTASSLTQMGPYFDLFSFPTGGEVGGVASGTEAYFSFDYANVHFISLDSNGSDRSVGSPMLQWLEADLQATTADWVVAFWHHPAYSKGSHDSDFEINLVEMRENALPILEGYGVDLVLAGHSHSYERSFLIDGHYGDSDTLDRGLSGMDEGDGDTSGDGEYRKNSAGMAPNEGAVHAVAGSSGKVSGGSLDHPAMLVSTSTLGSMALDFDGDILDAVFIDDTGAELDRFRIRKGVAAITRIDGARDTDEGQPMTFTAEGRLANGTPITSFDWSFGDGTPDELDTDNVTHTWPGEGEYEMIVTAEDETGTPFTELVRIRIDNAPPVVDPLVPPASCDEGELITWYGTATDPGGDPITYVWDFGDGMQIVGQQVVYALGDDGPHTITLYATDDAGAQGFAEMQVTCNNLPPTFQGLSHPPLVEQTPMTLTALVTDPGRDDTFTIEWELDGHLPGVGDQFDALFATTGNYALQITVTDDDGGQIVVGDVLVVTNGPPVLDVLTISEGAGEGEIVDFSALAHEVSGEPFTISWDFGDGVGAIGPMVGHAYADDGVYPVTLALDDGTPGGRIEHVVDILIENRPAFVEDVLISDAVEGSPVTLVAIGADPGLSDVLSYSWTFDYQQFTGSRAVWTPGGDGGFTAWLTVADDHDEGETVPVMVDVANAPPVIEGLPPTTEAFVDTEWSWKVPASDPGGDPLTFDLSGPTGSFVEADGTVHWVPDPDHEDTEQKFAVLVRDDANAGAEYAWTVRVGPAFAGRHASWRGYGCTQAPGPLAFWWLALLAIRRRHSQG